VRYLSTTEAAAKLHVDPSRVRLLCKLGRIETIKVGNTYAISEHELERFAAIPRRPGRPRRGESERRRSPADSAGHVLHG
jgi:excisionase family DNA binding protein